ncbi:hypothetical protein CHS0354_025562 [Potamilus streckersoni]|uniref:Uncharacterized protein n=1 Tax=Potamilus streckersoni TaxID=2493646 RepID=A0AAE0VMK1_9BIVA|nr:hypothetical protein CHS0354_025562 [Potamilus streckersoni]
MCFDIINSKKKIYSLMNPNLQSPYLEAGRCRFTGVTLNPPVAKHSAGSMCATILECHHVLERDERYAGRLLLPVQTSKGRQVQRLDSPTTKF